MTGWGETRNLQQVMDAVFSKKLDHVGLVRGEDARLLESKGFGVREKQEYYLKDYEVLYLMYN